MKVAVHKRSGYLVAELQGRENARDMRQFLQAVKSACLEHTCPRVLMSIKGSNTMFKAEDYGLDGAVKGYLGDIITPSCRIALLADSSELHHAHEYIQLVARQQHINVRAFRDGASAIRWLESADPVGPTDLDGLQPGRPSKPA